MSVRFTCARALSAASTWALKTVFHRPAANFPGQIALRVDPQTIAHTKVKLQCGSICVVGTNGKTTTTNLLANALECAGYSVVCNRTGANLASGVTTALLHAKPSQWGVLECDELWLAHITPQLQPNYVLLLNLFRDQLDRVGEIARVQDSIAQALEASPQTTLIYNADDPLCTAIAARVSNPSVAFGVAESMNLQQNTVSDTTMCQQCSAMMTYHFRQYGQLGNYECPTCGFKRPALNFAARKVLLNASGLAFDLVQNASLPTAHTTARISAPMSGSYMVYNLLACAVAAQHLGCSPEHFQEAVNNFNPQNGRLQTYCFQGRHVLLNLAKNPTGFNQNLKIVAQDKGSKAVALFINDKEADGHDVSWLWDIDFEELAASGTTAVYASGIRGNDMQVRLKYAGIESVVMPDANAVLDALAQLPPQVNGYLIANYTALPAVKAALDARATTGEQYSEASNAHMSAEAVASAAEAEASIDEGARASDVQVLQSVQPTQDAQPAHDAQPIQPTQDATSNDPVVIAHLFPDLLNLYGDGGNVRILEQRLRWRGIPVEVQRISSGENSNLSQVDLVFLGGGPDREQKLASSELMRMKTQLQQFVEADGALLAICGGYQILGHEWLWGDSAVEGLSILDLTTRRPGTSANRLIDNIVLASPIASQPVVGYENHAGRTYLGKGLEPFGHTISQTGCGNNEETHADGVLYRKLIGTYLHGPLLAKNPEVADWLLDAALQHYTCRTGYAAPQLSALDDSCENAANQHLRKRWGLLEK